MSRLRQLIHEIHRRSVWQVLMIYLGASWAVMEATDQIVDRYLLPEWVYPAALILLLIGLPIVLATAFVREERRDPEPVAEIRDPTLLGATWAEAPAAAARTGTPLLRLLTWPKAILGGVLAFTALGLVSAAIVLRGTARVTEAYGAAGEAFEERAWVVLAKFEAPESEYEVALAAQAALEVDLQQSQYVNLRGRNQVKPVLRRMGVADTTALNEELALEVAEREGLSAVLAPAVSRLGSEYVFSARVVQPGTGEELIAVRTVASEDRLVEAVEKLSRELRARLGESGDAIRRSRPLPEVTTRSLEALKIYAQAVQASRDQRYPRALELSLEAIKLDSTFAMSHRLASVSYSNMGRYAESAEAATRAYELRDRLTDRERLHVEGFYYLSADGEFEPRRAAEIYELLLSRYPDDFRAANNIAFTASGYLGDSERAYRAQQKAVELDPYSAVGYTNAVSEALTLHRWEAAESLSAAAKARDVAVDVTRSDIPISVAREDWERADALCDSVMAEPASPGELVERQTYCGGLAAMRGHLSRGIELIESAGRSYAQRGGLIDHANLQIGLASIEQMRGRQGAARSRLEAMLDRYPADSIADGDRYIVRANLTVAAGALGQADLIDRLGEAYPRESDPTHWLARYGATVEDAARALSIGEPDSAVALLRDLREFGYKPLGWEYDRHLLFGLAFDALGMTDSAVAHYEETFDPGQFSGWGTWVVRGSRTQLPFAVRRIAELEESRGNTEEAIRQYRRLLSLWSDPDPELRGQLESARRALARLTGAEAN